MSEPITPLNVSQPANTSEVVPKDRRKVQFSIRSMLLFTLFVAMALTSVLMYRQVSETEKELVKLRNEAGYLKIEDETLFQALALDCQEPLTWKWRVFLPKGSKYSWHLDSGNISEFDVPKGGVYTSEQLPRTKGTEAIITVSIRKDPEVDKKRWTFNLSCRATEGNERNSIGGTIPDNVMDKILQCPMKSTQLLGSLKPETRKPGESIVILQYHIGEQSPPNSNSWTSLTTKRQPGFAVWLEAK